MPRRKICKCFYTFHSHKQMYSTRSTRSMANRPNGAYHLCVFTFVKYVFYVASSPVLMLFFSLALTLMRVRLFLFFQGCWYFLCFYSAISHKRKCEQTIFAMCCVCAVRHQLPILREHCLNCRLWWRTLMESFCLSLLFFCFNSFHCNVTVIQTYLKTLKWRDKERK